MGKCRIKSRGSKQKNTSSQRGKEVKKKSEEKASSNRYLEVIIQFSLYRLPHSNEDHRYLE